MMQRLTFFLCTLTLFRWMNCDDLKEKLVFEAFSYGPSTSYSLYVGNQVSPGNFTTKKHFKHPLVNMWGKDIVVNKVTLAIMKDFKVAAYVVFGGEGTTRTSWMNQSRILNSSYSDIKTSPANYFSVPGVPISKLNHGRRAFYINKRFDGCQLDKGWIQVLTEGVGVCDYEKVPGYTSITLVSYSPTSKVGKWIQSTIADSMKIYIQYEEIVQQESTKPMALASTEPTAAIILTDTVVLSSTPETPRSEDDSSKQPPHKNCSECCVHRNFSEQILTIGELKELVQLLKLQLQVNKTNLSLFVRRRTCATDKRLSVTVIGSVIGATTLAIVFGVIVLPDLITLGRYLWKKFN